MSDSLIAIEASHNIYLQRLATQYGNEILPHIDLIKERIAVRLEKESGKKILVIATRFYSKISS